MQEQPNKTVQDIIAKRKEHSRRVDSKLILKAYNYAKSHHGEQLRKSGEPYIIHPLNVAYILADMGLDDSTIAAALLHDVVEDTEVTENDITKEFRRRNFRNGSRSNKIRKYIICISGRTTSRRL